MKINSFIKLSLALSCFGLLGFTKVDLKKTTPRGSLTLEEQLERAVGQKEFINPMENFGWGRGLKSARGGALETAASPAAMADSAGPVSGKRDFLESDMYASDVDSNVLFVLNKYRGLQAIKYVKNGGKYQAAIVGHVAPTGNNPSKMFFDKKQKRLIVLESTLGTLSSYYNPQSRVVIYDVSNTQKPKIAKTDLEAFRGNIIDEYFDNTKKVLYVVAGDSYYGKNPKAFIYSFDFNGKAKAGDMMQLSLAAGSAKDIQFSEVPVKGGYKYYLTAILKNYNRCEWKGNGVYQAIPSEDNWDHNTNYVEVVDISDHTQFLPAMVAKVKGQINEKDQIQIRGNKLMVVSNFRSGGKRSSRGCGWSWGRGNSRIALESFTLPSNDDVYNMPINDKRIQAVNASIDADLQAMGLVEGSYEERVARAKLVKQKLSNKYFMKGVTVLGKDGRKSKVGRLYMPFSSQEILPTEDLKVGAALRDVRVSEDGKYLYAFWVPENKIDPMEVFNIENPNKIVHHGRLSFKEGWVEKAIPFMATTNDGKKVNAVIGLGLREAPGTRWGRELVGIVAYIKEQPADFGTGTRVVPLEIGSAQVLDTTGAWRTLNIDDKLWTININADGAGVILLPPPKWNSGKEATSNGLKLSVSLTDLKAGGQFFSVEKIPSRKGNAKRIFNNKLTDGTASFSDLELFESYTDAQRAKAELFVELARQIRDYVSLSKTSGIQLIANGSNSCGWWRKCNPLNMVTEVRVVSSSNPDAELASIKGNKVIKLKSSTLKGTYKTHLVDKSDNTVYVLTSLVKKTFMPNRRRPEKAHIQEIESFFVSVITPKGSRKVSTKMVGNWERKSERTYPWYLTDAKRIDNVIARDGANAIKKQRADWVKRNLNSMRAYNSTNYKAQLLDKMVMFTSGKEAYKATASKVTPMAVAGNCDFGLKMTKERYDAVEGADPMITDFSLMAVDKKLFVHYQTIANDSKVGMYYRNFVSVAKMSGNSIKCTKAVNVPGKPMAYHGNTLVTGDYYKTMVKNFSDKPAEKGNLRAVAAMKFNLKGKKVRLASMVEGNRTLRAFDNNDYYIEPWFFYFRNPYRAAPKMNFVGNKVIDFLPTGKRFERNAVMKPGTHTLQVMSVKGGKFGDIKEVQVKLSNQFDARIVKVLATEDKNEHLIVLSSNGKLQVLSMDSDSNVEVLGLKAVDTYGKVGSEVSSVGLWQHYFYDAKFNYSPATQTLEIPQGLFGVQRIKLVK